MAGGLFASWPGSVAVGEETAGHKNKDWEINWISIYILMLMEVNVNGKLLSDMGGKGANTFFELFKGELQNNRAYCSFPFLSLSFLDISFFSVL